MRRLEVVRQTAKTIYEALSDNTVEEAILGGWAMEKVLNAVEVMFAGGAKIEGAIGTDRIDPTEDYLLRRRTPGTREWLRAQARVLARAQLAGTVDRMAQQEEAAGKWAAGMDGGNRNAGGGIDDRLVQRERAEHTYAIFGVRPKTKRIASATHQAMTPVYLGVRNIKVKGT